MKNQEPGRTKLCKSHRWNRGMNLRSTESGLFLSPLSNRTLMSSPEVKTWVYWPNGEEHAWKFNCCGRSLLRLLLLRNDVMLMAFLLAHKNRHHQINKKKVVQNTQLFNGRVKKKQTVRTQQQAERETRDVIQLIDSIVFCFEHPTSQHF